MKVYLDDERVAPDGWVQVRWKDKAIELLQTGAVTHLSLDHDLGMISEEQDMTCCFGLKKLLCSTGLSHPK